VYVGTGQYIETPSEKLGIYLTPVSICDSNPLGRLAD